jgi:beta-barrel assembly-enhancing protease
MRPRSTAILLALLAAASLCAADQNKKDDPNQIGNRDVGKCVNFYSVEKEIALGKQLAEEVSRQAKVNRDPILGEFVNRVGQNLVRSSDAKVPFTFQVVEDDTPNAFALPGGFVFVNTGLLKLASEEDEFAGALAHEIAHVAARHLTCRATKQEIASVAGGIGGVILGRGIGGVAAREATSFGLPMAFLKFSRSDESEADYLGTQYMYAAGYDPNGAVTIFEKLAALQKTQPNLAARLMATHPMDNDRIDKTEKEIQRILPAKPDYVVTTSEYTDIRERVIAAGHKSDPTRPTLRRAQPDSTDDTRPTVKRRELVP